MREGWGVRIARFRDPAPWSSISPWEPVIGQQDVPAVVAAVVADLASRLGIDVSDVTIGSYEGVTWSDGSLGCPRPGMLYTQALVPGLRVVLAVGRATYEYHTGEDGRFVHCPDPAPPVGRGRATR